MKRIIQHTLTLLIHLLISSLALAQVGTGNLSGTVSDETNGEAIPFANVVLLQNGQQVTGASTDFDGYYKISSIKPGTYSIRVSTVGFSPKEKSGVLVKANLNSIVDFKLNAGLFLNEVTIESHVIPIIEKDATQGLTIGGDEIRSLAGRGVASIATQAVGVQDNDGGVGSIKGTRAGSTNTYIDGVRVRGSASLPRAAREQPLVGLGGTPAQQEVRRNERVVIQARKTPTTTSNNIVSSSTEKKKKRKKEKPTELVSGYDLYRSQSFKNVFSEPLSTFSIDVDAASYSQIRRSINMGVLPPLEIVRIEEMINYFNYDYPQPEGSEPFSINTEVSACPWDATNQLVHIGLQGKELKMKNRPENNLVFLIDVSGSMGFHDKLPLLQKSLRLLVNELEKTDNISIVVYAGAAGMVLPPTTGNKKDEILRAINNLHAGGSTAGGAGIELAYSIAQKQFIKKGNNRVILCTDGDFNVGISSDHALVKLIEKKRESGVFLTILGFGTGSFKDGKMEKLADKGNGNFAYIDNLQEAQKVLVQEFWGTLFTIAKDVKIQVEFNPTNVLAYRLIGYENRRLAAEDFNDDKKDAGELGAGHTVTALYEIIPAGSKLAEEIPLIDTLKYQLSKARVTDGLEDELLSVKLRYKKPDEDVSSLLSESLSKQLVPIEESSANLRFAAALSQFGMILLDEKLDSAQRMVQIQKVIAMAKKSKGVDEDGRRAEFIRLAELAMVIN